jgi:predicted CXXCH cytochrome family protein
VRAPNRRHGPFAAGDCVACHAVHTDRPGVLRGAPGAACVGCHPEPIRPVARGGSQHAPVVAGACSFCHDAHGTGRPRNLRQETALLCLSCHAELQARIRDPKLTLHVPVKAGACLECHASHASANPRLLRSEPPELCGGCHHLGSEKMTRAHGGPAASAGRCVGCHDPHVRKK